MNRLRHSCYKFLIRFLIPPSQSPPLIGRSRDQSLIDYGRNWIDDIELSLQLFHQSSPNREDLSVIVRITLILAGVSLIIANLMMLVSRQQPAQSAWLTFMSDRDDNWEIYRMHPNGSDIERLTFVKENDMFLNWSKDGKWIIYLSWREGEGKLFRQHVVTGREEMLPDDPFTMMFPNFGQQQHPESPDGEWVVFSARVDENQLVNIKNDDGIFEPMWSPNGQMLAYSRSNSGVWNLFRGRPDGSELRQLTSHDGIDGAPIWSADSSELIFASSRDGNWNIYRMNSDGSEETTLTDHPAQDLNPVYAPVIDLSVQNIALLLLGIGMTFAAVISMKYRKPLPEFR